MPLRARMVLHGLVFGSPNKVIADELGISPRTVETHRAAIIAKLGARSLVEAVRLALAAGLGKRREGRAALAWWHPGRYSRPFPRAGA